MKKLYLFSFCLLFTVCLLAQDEKTSIPLKGTCLNPDDGTIDFIFDLNENCPEADPNGELPGVMEMGYHSGINDWSTIIAWDAPTAIALMNNGNDSFLVTIDVFDYYGVEFADMVNIKMVVNNGFANPADPWTIALRDSTNGENFGDPTDCSDLLMIVADLPTCKDLNQTSSLVLFSDAGDAKTCVDPNMGLIQIDLDYDKACPEADSTKALAGAPSLGFHSGANDWSSVVSWNDPTAVQLVNDGNDNFSAIIDPEVYYGVPYADMVNINLIGNNGPNDPAAPWDIALRDPKDGGSFGNPEPCSDIFLLIAEAPICDLETNTKDVLLERSMEVYPNPFSNRAFLEFDNPNSDGFNLTITDMTGRIVRTMNNINNERVLIERESLVAGIYLATLTDSNGHFATTKLVVK